MPQAKEHEDKARPEGAQGSLNKTTTRAAREERGKLQSHFGRRDILFYLICTLVGMDTIGAVAKNGAQGFTWLAFLGVFFFLPYGLLTAELGAAFTDEGGPYVWTRLAFGRLAGAVTAVLYWVSNPIWVGGSLCITAVTAFGDFVTPLHGAAKYGFALAFIWLSVGSAVISLKVGKWLPTVGAWARIAVLSFFTFTVGLYAARHGVHGFHTPDFLPTYAVFIAAVPVLIFNYTGFELPNAAGEEMQHPQRDVPAMVAWSAGWTLLLYGLPILAVLLVLPTGEVTGLGGFLDAVKAVFTVYGGTVASGGAVTLTGWGKAAGEGAMLAFLLATLSSGSAWLMGADRILAVAAYDGAGPRALGRFSARFGTPLTVNLISGAVSTLTMLLAFRFSHGSAEQYFSAAIALAISTETLAYLAIFPAFLRLRYVQTNVRRPYRVPGGMAGAWVCGGLTTMWALLATVGLIWPGFGIGWFGTSGRPDDALPGGFAHQRMAYELIQNVPLTLFVLLGLLFYRLGKRTREEGGA